MIHANVRKDDKIHLYIISNWHHKGLNGYSHKFGFFRFSFSFAIYLREPVKICMFGRIFH